MLLFARHLVKGGEVAHHAGAQVAHEQVAHGVLGTLCIGSVVHGMGMKVVVGCMHIEVLEGGKSRQRIGQQHACEFAKPEVKLGTQVKAARAFERFEEVGVPRAQPGIQGAKDLEEAPAAGL